MHSLDRMRLICVHCPHIEYVRFYTWAVFLVNIKDSYVPMCGLVSPWADSGTCV